MGMDALEGLKMRVLTLELGRTEDQKTVGRLVEAIHELANGLAVQSANMTEHSTALTVFTTNLETKFNTMFKTMSLCAVITVTLAGGFFGYQTFNDSRYMPQQTIQSIQAQK